MRPAIFFNPDMISHGGFRGAEKEHFQGVEGLSYGRIFAPSLQILYMANEFSTKDIFSLF